MKKLSVLSTASVLCIGFLAVSPAMADVVEFKCVCQQSYVDTVNSVGTEEATYSCSETQADNYEKEMNMSEKYGKIELQGKMIALVDGQTEIELRFAPRNGAIMKSVQDVTGDKKEEWSGTYKDGDWKTIDDFRLQDNKDSDGVIFMKSSVAGFGGSRDGGKQWSYAVSVLYFLHNDSQYKAGAVCIQNK